MIKETIVKLEGEDLKYREECLKFGEHMPTQRTVKISDVPVPVWIMGCVLDGEDSLLPRIGEEYEVDPETHQLTKPQKFTDRPSLDYGDVEWFEEFTLTPDSIYAADFDDGQALTPFWFSGYLTEGEAEEARNKLSKRSPGWKRKIIPAQIPANEYFFALESWREEEKVSEVVFRKIEPLGWKGV